MKGCLNLNPRILTAYFLAVLLISMFLWNPVIQIISLSGSLLFLLSISDIKGFTYDLGFYAVLFLLITITNPLFSHNGETPLFFMNGNPITLEAIIYGSVMGIMIISVIIWCKCFGRIMTTDKILYVFGGFAPKLTLILSMALRFIPMFKKQAKKVSNAQKTMGLFSQKSITDKTLSSSSVLSSMTGWALENAVETGNSMKSKGYGLKPRTSYFMFKFSINDGLVIAFTIVLSVVTLACTAMGKLDFNFYPSISKISFDFLSLTAYISFGILSLLPFIIEMEGNIKWKYYISKI
ncbi:MAG: energy-coupling factor transporter transmembrane protein EcfT [Ruminococcus sp.]|nr:energy-coupling factor transporter transmembrane protein EcfT [Ruminococcus sp.]